MLAFCLTYIFIMPIIRYEIGLNEENMDYLKEHRALFCEADSLFNSIMESSGLSASEHMTIFCLSQGIDTQSAICKRLYVPKQTIHSVIKKLEQQGLVTLCPNPNDNKSKRITLTDAGYNVYKEKVAPVEDVEEEAFKMLSEQEQQTYVELSKKYNSLLREKTQEYLDKYDKN